MDFKFKSEKKMLKDKIVIIVNGKGGVGKDTICDAVSHFFRATHISAITPVKEIAKTCGWNGEKDLNSRRFLSQLKQVLIRYHQYPTKCLIKELKLFLQDESSDILFIDIREADQIEEFKKAAWEVSSALHVCTLLVRSNRPEIHKEYGNKSDDEVELYKYDYIFENSGSIELLEEKVWHFFVTLFQEQGILDSCMPFVKVIDE